MKIKLTVEYCGEAFHGWQRQEGLATVQGSLEQALLTLSASIAKKNNLAPIEKPILVTGSGRTDAGVHALGQVASFVWPDEIRCEPERILSALNALTPYEMVVREAVIVPDSFDARFSPHVKCYQYRMLLRDVGPGYYLHRAWVVGEKLDINAMIRAAKLFVGQHNFASFRARDCSAETTERTLVLSEISRPTADELLFTVFGKGFLKQMIRIMTGTLVEIGQGRRAPEDILRLLQISDRSQAGMTAPPDGLTMVWVRYLD